MKSKLCVTICFKAFKPKTKISFRIKEMSLPECEGPANSTLCFLPELLEELQISETVRFQDFINVSPAAFTRDWERWMLWGKTKQKNLKTSKFSTFGTQSILLPIQWWAQVRKFEVNFYESLNTDCFFIEIKSFHCLNRDWFIWFSVGIILNSAVLLIAGRQSKRSDMITCKKNKYDRMGINLEKWLWFSIIC